MTSYQVIVTVQERANGGLDCLIEGALEEVDMSEMELATKSGWSEATSSVFVIHSPDFPYDTMDDTDYFSSQNFKVFYIK